MSRAIPIILGILLLCYAFWAMRHQGPESRQNEVLGQEAPRILESASSVSIRTRRETRAAESADDKTRLWQEIQPIVERKPYRYPGFGTPGSLNVNRYTRIILNLTPEEEKRLDDELLPQLFQRYGDIEARSTEIKEDGDSSFLLVKGDPEAKLKFKNELYETIVQELGEKRGYALFQMILRNSWFELAGVDREISFLDDGEHFEIRDTVVNPSGDQFTRFSETLYHDEFISSGRYNHLIDEEAWTQFINNLPIK